MGIKFQIHQITNRNANLLKKFIEGLVNEKKTFRYFNNRNLSVLKNHLCTILLTSEDQLPIAYGHLDKESEIIWLGIVIKNEFQGKGLGKVLMQILLDKAIELKIEEICLSVDRTNERAIDLYEKWGFELMSEYDNYYILKLKLNDRS